MKRRVRNRLKWILERWIQQGAAQQLLLMVALIVLVAVVGGVLAWMLTDSFDGPAEATWWAFLRLTDPGYLGDDSGATLRTISTIVTILGYVLFMGSLIAILTQWLNRTMRQLESGLTPIAMQGHFLILGWTNRTPSIVRELALSEGRVRRFLKRRGVARLRIVILAENVSAELVQELRDILGRTLKRSQIILRSGSSMRLEHLARVDFSRAAAILLPGSDYAMGGAESMDSRVIKTLMSISRYWQGGTIEDYPIVVAEILDTHKVPIAEQAYQGQAHVLSSDAFVSRLIAQNVRHRGLSHVYSELLSHTHGNEVYVRSLPAFAGAQFGDLEDIFPDAILLGIARPTGKHFRPVLVPRPDFRLEPDDRLAMISRSYEETTPATSSLPANRRYHLPVRPPESPESLRRILVLGWNHRVPALVREFSSYPGERFEIDLLSVIPSDERSQKMRHIDLSGERLSLRHLDGDYTLRADLEQLNLDTYDNVVFLGSDWLDSSEETDARTILGYLLLRTVLTPDRPPPEILVELKDPENNRLFRHRMGEVIISPVILSHMLAHAALRQELTSIFNELFGPGGAEIFFRRASVYTGTDPEVSFRDVQAKASARGEIALGVRLAARAEEPDGGVKINPGPLSKWRFADDDEVIVLTKYT